jgi:hypothetical protein
VPLCAIENALPALAVQPVGVVPAKVSWIVAGCARLAGMSNTQASPPHPAMTRLPLTAKPPTESLPLAASVATCE